MTSIRRFLSLASASALAVALLAAPFSRAAEPLLLQWGTIDTSSDAAQGNSAALRAKVAKKAAIDRKRKAAPSRAAYLVQFESAITEEWREWLEGATQVRGYIPENAYAVWATAGEMEAIAAHEGVCWVGEWKKDYKTVRAGTAAAAKGASSASAPAARWMRVDSFLSGADGAASLRARLEALGADVRSAFPRLDGCAAVAFLADAQIDAAASWPDVEWIEPQLEYHASNDKAAQTNMMNVAPVWNAIGDGGLGLTGAGQIVGVADSGLDLGSTVNVHEDFAGRVLAGYGWVNRNYDPTNSWMDASGHGTHVCGSILGDGAKSGGLYKGMAREARFVFQGCQSPSSSYFDGLPDDLTLLFGQAFDDGVRIHSDSWGGTANGAYPDLSAGVDEFAWQHQDFLAVFAAGNSGRDANADGVIDPGSVEAPATAKNCLCVGAAVNYRSEGGHSGDTWGEGWPEKYPAEPIAGDKISSLSVPQGLAAFSSRGPTTDGRIKPDIVAPGTDVISVRSRGTANEGWGVVAWNTNYLFNGGTSMATPLTSGALVLAREWLQRDRGMADPPAALLKALLVAGARDMSPGQYGTGQYREIWPRPDRSQGFGHVDLVASLAPGDDAFLTLVTNKLSKTGAVWTDTFDVGAVRAGKYVLALAWQDYPGALGAGKTLVNDLDLSVTTPSGEVLHPNKLDAPDRANNVELVEFEAAETGAYGVRVVARNIAKVLPDGAGQPFSLVMRGPRTTRPEFASPDPALDVVFGGEIAFDFAAHLASGAWPLPGFSIETAVSADLWTLGDDGILYFRPDLPGFYEFACTASNADGTASCTLYVTVRPAAPEAIYASSLGSTSLCAMWPPVTGADSYRLDIVRGLSFEARPGRILRQEGFASDFPFDWVYKGVGTYDAPPFLGPRLPGGHSIRFNDAGDYVSPTDIAGATAFECWTYGDGDASSELDLYYSTADKGSDWEWFDTLDVQPGPTAWPAIDIPEGAVRLLINLGRRGGDVALDDIVFYTGNPIPAGEWLPGFSNLTVNATNICRVDGLDPLTVYSMRVRAVAGGLTGPNSPATAYRTTTEDVAPAWEGLPATATLGLGDTLSLDLGQYNSGSPLPDLYLEPDGIPGVAFDPDRTTFDFTPVATNIYTFTFIASNVLGKATHDLTVTVFAEAPSIDIGNVTVLQGETVDLFLSADGAPAPVLSVAGPDGFRFDPATGEFYFVPPAVGDYVFTVTAANSVGTANREFTVTATARAVPVLAISDITATTALATWSECQGVDSYTIRLFTNNVTYLDENFDHLTRGDITTNDLPGWTFSNDAYCGFGGGSGFVRVGTANSPGWICTPPLERIPAGAALECLLLKVGSDTGTVAIEVTEDDGQTWTSLREDPVVPDNSGRLLTVRVSRDCTNARIRFRASEKRFWIDYLLVSHDDPEQTPVDEFTASGTSRTLDGLEPDTRYIAFVKGDAGWSDPVKFPTSPDGTVPSWSALPEPEIAVRTPCVFRPADYADGTPEPVVLLQSADAPDGTYALGDDGTFRFTPPVPGTFDFAFLASNRIAVVSALFTVTATEPEYDRWLGRHRAVGANPLALAPNGHTFYENYIADIDPASPFDLAIDFTDPASDTFGISNASADRYYQLLYTTNLMLPLVPTNLGWGCESDFTFPSPGTWFGRLRVLLSEPSDP